MREVINIHIGQAGIQSGNACWEVRSNLEPMRCCTAPQLFFIHACSSLLNRRRTFVFDFSSHFRKLSALLPRARHSAGWPDAERQDGKLLLAMLVNHCRRLVVSAFASRFKIAERPCAKKEVERPPFRSTQLNQIRSVVVMIVYNTHPPMWTHAWISLFHQCSPLVHLFLMSVIICLFASLCGR